MASPLDRAVRAAVLASIQSPCRSKRGVVIFKGDALIGSGINRQPDGFNCNSSAECKATCRRTAIHAEQLALLRVGLVDACGADLVHVKTVDGVLVPSGPPSCLECSKLIIEAGIVGVWLYHKDGWRRYSANEFHRLTLEGQGHAATPAEERKPKKNECVCGHFNVYHSSWGNCMVEHCECRGYVDGPAAWELNEHPRKPAPPAALDLEALTPSPLNDATERARELEAKLTAQEAVIAQPGVQVYFDCGCADHIPSGSVPLACSLHKDGRAKRIDILGPPAALDLEALVKALERIRHIGESWGATGHSVAGPLGVQVAEIADAALRPAPIREETGR